MLREHLASILARVTGEDVADRDAVLKAIDFPTVALMKSLLDDATYAKLLARVEQRMTKDLLRTFPGAPLEGIRLDRTCRAAPRALFGRRRSDAPAGH